jgi:hypothetical protein
MIVSARRTYLNDFAAIEAPALKNLERISTEMRAGAGASQVDIRSFPHATLPYQSLIEARGVPVERAALAKFRRHVPELVPEGHHYRATRH